MCRDEGVVPEYPVFPGGDRLAVGVIWCGMVWCGMVWCGAWGGGNGAGFVYREGGELVQVVVKEGQEVVVLVWPSSSSTS